MAQGDKMGDPGRLIKSYSDLHLKALKQHPLPDLVIWPENSSDIDPFLNEDAARQIDRAAGAIGVPILVGAVTDASALRAPHDVGNTICVPSVVKLAPPELNGIDVLLGNGLETKVLM